MRAVAFSPDGATALSGSAGGDGYAAAQLWGIVPETSFAQWLFQARGGLASLALGPDGQVALTGSEDRTAQLWDVTTRRPIGPAMHHEDRVSAVTFSHDGQFCVTGDNGGLVRLWERAGGSRPRHELRSKGWIASLSLSPDDRTAVIGVGFLAGVEGSGSRALFVGHAHGRDSRRSPTPAAPSRRTSAPTVNSW